MRVFRSGVHAALVAVVLSILGCPKERTVTIFCQLPGGHVQPLTVEFSIDPEGDYMPGQAMNTYVIADMKAGCCIEPGCDVTQACGYTPGSTTMTVEEWEVTPQATGTAAMVSTSIPNLPQDLVATGPPYSLETERMNFSVVPFFSSTDMFFTVGADDFRMRATLASGGSLDFPDACAALYVGNQPVAFTVGGPTVSNCLDGNVDIGEACDDGAESATCDADCTIAECGDGQTNMLAGEICDHAFASADCDTDCTRPACGDGEVNQFAGEECDDGNLANGDGCDDACILEAGAPFLLFRVQSSSGGTLHRTVDGGPPVLVSSASSNVPAQRHYVSPNGRYVAYLSDERGAGQDELFVTSVGATGGGVLVQPIPGVASAVSWSPDSARIRFRVGGVIYTTTPLGADTISVATGTGPVWSPDGTKLVYDQGGQLFLANADGSSAAAIPNAFTGLSPPIWRPDSGGLAYSGGSPGFPTVVYTIDADGTNQTVVSLPSAPPRPHVLLGSVSPSSSRLVYLRVDLFNLPTIPAPFSVNIDGSDNQPLVDPTTTSSYTWDWNSDGSRLLGVVFVDPQSDLISMAADGADVHAINLPLTEVDNPPGAWNADGTRVAFTSVAAGTTFPVTLYTATATGTDHQQVDAAPLSPRHFKWSPNGTRVAYTTGDGIYAADSDGSNHAELDSVVDMSSSFIANTSQAYYWGPNGADIAYVANQGSSTGYELYVGAADGTGNVKVSGTLAAGTNVTQATWVEIAP